MKTTVWDKLNVLVNSHLLTPLPRVSMWVIVCLFTKTTAANNTEEYLYPNIESVNRDYRRGAKHGLLAWYTQVALLL